MILYFQIQILFISFKSFYHFRIVFFFFSHSDLIWRRGRSLILIKRKRGKSRCLRQLKTTFTAASSQLWPPRSAMDQPKRMSTSPSAPETKKVWIQATEMAVKLLICNDPKLNRFLGTEYFHNQNWRNDRFVQNSLSTSESSSLFHTCGVPIRRAFNIYFSNACSLTPVTHPLFVTHLWMFFQKGFKPITSFHIHTQMFLLGREKLWWNIYSSVDFWSL